MGRKFLLVEAVVWMMRMRMRMSKLKLWGICLLFIIVDGHLVG